MSGIYKILNILNGKMYIGSSVSFEQRWTQHRSELRRNKHHSPKLQRAWNKYGEDAFVFSIIEECAPEILEKREQFWMDHYNAYGRHGYNIALVAGRAMLGRNHTDEAKAKISEAQKAKQHSLWRKRSDETRAKISEANKGKKLSPETRAKLSEAAKNCSPETRAKLSEAKKGNQNRLGHKHSDEAKAKMSEAGKGKPKSNETKAKLSASQLGKKHTEETKAKISAAAKRRWAHLTP